MIWWWNELAIQKNENHGFHEKHKIDWQIPSQSEILMKTWYFLVVLAVIFVFAVCRFNIIKISFWRKPFFRRNKNFQVLRFFRISADPASRAYRKHSPASGLPKPDFILFVIGDWKIGIGKKTKNKIGSPPHPPELQIRPDPHPKINRLSP